MTLFELSYAGLWALALILACLTVVLLYQFSYILNLSKRYEERAELAAVQPLTAGVSLRRFSGRDLHTGAVRDSNDWGGKPFVVLALSPGCASCKALAKEMLSTGGSADGDGAIFAVCVGAMSTCEATLSAVRSVPVVVAKEDDVPELVTTGLPLAISVDAAGIVKDVRHPTSVTDLSTMLAAVRESDDPAFIQGDHAHAMVPR